MKDGIVAPPAKHIVVDLDIVRTLPMQGKVYRFSLCTRSNLNLWRHRLSFDE